MLNDWKEEFAPHILARGKKYFEEGRVCCLTQLGNTIRATVEGTENYTVEVELPGGVPEWMECSCPYAENGENCKHMAAVLFAVEAAEFTFTDDTDPGLPELPQRVDVVVPWLDAIDNLPEKVVRRELLKLADQSPSLQERLAIIHLGGLPEGQLHNWKVHLLELARSAGDRHGFLDYDDAYEFLIELSIFLSDKLPVLLEVGSIMDAFKLIWLVLETAMEQKLSEDAGDDLMEFVNDCSEDLELVFANATESQQEEMLVWFWKHRNSAWPCGTALVDSLFLNLPRDGTLQKQNLKFLDQEIQNCGNKERLPEFLSMQAEIMKRLGSTPADLLALWKQYHDLPYARKQELEYYLENDKPAAVSLLQEIRVLDAENPKQVIACSKQLISLYEETGQQALYIEELHTLVLNCGCLEIPYVRRLKEVTPAEQWPPLFEQILSSTENCSIQCALLDLEKQYQRLLDKLHNSGSSTLFSKYFHTLKEWSTEKTRDSYVEILKAEMIQASTRKRIRTIIQHMEPLLTLPSGRETVERLADYWFAAFPQRKVMMEELRTAGYEWPKPSSFATKS